MNPTTITDVCGTNSGYAAHRKRNEAACGPCRQARAAYMRDFRQRRQDVYREELRRKKAREAALWRLGQLHHDEWMALYVEELANR